MNKVIATCLKYMVVLLSIGILTACFKEIEIDTSETASKVVVSSFFTDTSPWSVAIYNTFHLNNHKPSDPITNANVSVTGNNNTITLQHTENGIYVADEYPKIGVEYKLLVKIKGKDDIRAHSFVPYKSSLSKITTDLTERSVVNSYKSYSNMISVNFNITPSNKQNTLCRVRTLLFDTITGYNRYYFSEDSYNRMRKNGVEPQMVNKLKALKGQFIIGSLWNVLSSIFGEMKILGYEEKIRKATFFDRVDYRDPNAYEIATCVPREGLFYQQKWEEFTLLGNFSSKTPVDVFISSFKNNKRSEHWLEFLDLSPEYYQYQKDYLLQISNRGNITGAPVIVYSNITNATGIFAGYQKRIFRIDGGK